MAFPGARATVAAIVASAVALSTIGLVSAPAWADSTAAPASPTVVAAPSFATTAFHDEWDYSNADDLLLDNSGPAMNIASPSFSGGVLTYTAKPGSYVSPLWGGYPGSLYQNRDGGLAANDIPAASYDHLSFHAYSQYAVSAAIQWFNSSSLNNSTEGGQPFQLKPGWNEYDIPLGTNKFPTLKVNWAGTIKGIRLATSPTTNTTIKLDFVRLYKAGDAGAKASWNISGDPAQPYWSSTGAATPCTTPSQTCGPVQDAAGTLVPTGATATAGSVISPATGALTVDTSSYPAGTTLFLATPGGASVISGSAVAVQPRPQPIVDTPSAAGCGDYATSTFGRTWLSSASLLSVHNQKSAALRGGVLSATNKNNDPSVTFKVAAGGLSATVWRYLSVTETYSGSFNLKPSSGGGTMARAMWARPGQAMTETNDLLTYSDRPTVHVDLGMSASTLTEPEWTPRYGWSGTISALRWDPNEDPGARSWKLSNVTLGRECEVGAGNGYAITWHDPGYVAGTTAVIQAVSQSDKSVHQLGKVTERAGENSFAAKRGMLPLGDYTIRVVSTSSVGGGSSTGTAATPLRFTVPTTRVAGADRYGTGIAASKAQYPTGAATAIVASGANYPDALSAAPAAVKIGGPLLLTQPNALTGSVGNELKRLKAKKIYVVGGPSAVNAKVLTQIRQKTGVTPTRVSGADRYATSAAIAARFFPGHNASAFVATGLAFPDALSAASEASRLRAPVLLVNGKTGAPTSAVTAQLSRLKPSAIYAIGGTSALSSTMAARLAKSGKTTRLSGADRYATSVAVGKKFTTAASTAVLASGANFPDALVGSALAGVKGTPLYLSQKGCLAAPVSAELNRIKISSLTIMGGTAVLGGGLNGETRC